MRRAGALATLGVVAYLAMLAVLLPASLVAARVTLPPGVALDSVEGTVWNGRARLKLPGFTIEEVRWHWRALPLFSGRIAYDIDARANGIEAHASLARAWRTLEIRDAAGQSSAAAAAQALPLLAAWQPQGMLTFAVPRLDIREEDVRGEGEVHWRDAALAIAPVRPLGSYVLRVKGDGGPARVTLATLDGALRLAAEGTWSGRHVAMSGEARASGPDADALTSMLDLLGPRRADGAHTMQIVF
jgi:general secretion pathway protein N